MVGGTSSPWTWMIQSALLTTSCNPGNWCNQSHTSRRTSSNTFVTPHQASTFTLPVPVSLSTTSDYKTRSYWNMVARCWKRNGTTGGEKVLFKVLAGIDLCKPCWHFASNTNVTYLTQILYVQECCRSLPVSLLTVNLTIACSALFGRQVCDQH